MTPSSTDLGTVVGVALAGLTAYSHFLPPVTAVPEGDVGLVRAGLVYGSLFTVGLGLLIGWRTRSAAGPATGVLLAMLMVTIYERVIRGQRP